MRMITARFTQLTIAAVLAIPLVWTVMPGAARAGHEGGCQALHNAAFLDEAQTVRDLIRHGVDINCLDMLGQTPLVTAVNGASMESFDILLKSGARTDVHTEYGQTLLQHTKKKYASFSIQGGQAFRDLYDTMIARLQIAGAQN